MQAQDYLDGQVILIDKPLNWTSFQVVNKVRWLIKSEFNLKKIKVGHAGTLDPLATGLLILCSGKFTKQIDTYQAQEKEYTGTFTLGSTTPSYDLETQVDQEFSTAAITKEQILQTVSEFIGQQQQQPPIFSAIKKDGKRLYELARAGKTTTIAKRTITISEFEITGINMPDINFRVVCSKGTYIRSLAHDFGKALNNGAHLSALRRTRIGDFHVSNSLDIESFQTNLTQGR